MNSEGYVQVHKQMYDNYNLQYPNKTVDYPAYITNFLANPSSYPNTNWQDEMFRGGLTQNYQVSVRGGSEKPVIRYLIITRMIKVSCWVIASNKIMPA